MENNSNNSGLKAAIVVLALLLLGSIGYIFKLTSDNKETVTTLTTEKNTLSEELKAKIAEYDTMIADNTALKEELLAEQKVRHRKRFKIFVHRSKFTKK